MRDYNVFHKTVRGYFHMSRQLPLEDASGSYSEECGGGDVFYIAVTADGHGDPACTRSGCGAQMAVNAAMECLTKFAREVLNEPTSPTDLSIRSKLLLAKPNLGQGRSLARQSQIILRQLTDMIISCWYSALDADIRTHHFSQQELTEAGIDAEDYADVDMRVRACAHTYGTTLLAALMLPDLLILIQQGDGRCEVYYEENGSIVVDQPIPWDQLCHDRFTTSLCDTSAAERIRSWVLDLREHPLVACYLGSDGVDDSFEEMTGMHMFYNSLSCELANTQPIDLNKILSDLSQNGSGDDTSISGIYNPSLLRKHAPLLQAQAERYGLEQELCRCINRKKTMRRKHSILQRRMKDSDEVLEKWIKEMEHAYEQRPLQMEIDDLSQRIEQYARSLNEVRQKIEREEGGVAVASDWEEQDEYKSNRRSNCIQIKFTFPVRKGSVEQLRKKEQELYLEKCHLMRELDKKRLDLQQLEDSQHMQQEKLRQQSAAAMRKFNAYNATYEALNERIADLKKQIEVLNNRSPSMQPDMSAPPTDVAATEPTEPVDSECAETTSVTSLEEKYGGTVKVEPYVFTEFDK